MRRFCGMEREPVFVAVAVNEDKVKHLLTFNSNRTTTYLYNSYNVGELIYPELIISKKKKKDNISVEVKHSVSVGLAGN